VSIDEHLGILLADVGFAVRAHLRESRQDPTELARAVGHEGGDTIFAIDRAVEPIVVAAISSWPDGLLPLELVAEGMGADGRRRIGPNDRPPRWHLLIDPIDGTRSLMYDKRSAWFLAAAAPGSAKPPSLSRAAAAVMVELPTSRQGQADHFIAEVDGSLTAMRTELASGHSRPLRIMPSKARSLLHGFGQVSSFFPGTHQLAGALMDAIARVAAPYPLGGASIFNDQYISSGGQLCELLLGRDRFCCDLRPLFHRVLQRGATRAAEPSPLSCHPYDLAGLPIALRAGVIVTDGFGRPIDAQFNVHSELHWIGYANHDLRALIEPVIAGWLAEHDIKPD
jgi:hypothetical protein